MPAMDSRRLLLLTIVLVIAVGPLFATVPWLLLQSMEEQRVVGFTVLGFAIIFPAVALWLWSGVKREGLSLRDFGWGVPSGRGPIFVGIFVAIFWGIFLGAGGYYQDNPFPQYFEDIDFFRIWVPLLAFCIAPAEDFTRAYIMNTLRDRGASGKKQLLIASAVFALYHSIWSLTVGGLIAGLISMVIGFVFSFLFGAILAGLFLWSGRSLTPVIIAHGGALLLGEPYLTTMMVRQLSAF